jgi:hypothetical protein
VHYIALQPAPLVVYKSLLLGIALLRDGCSEAQVRAGRRRLTHCQSHVSPQAIVFGLLQGKDGAPFLRAIQYRLLRALDEVKEAKRALKQRRYVVWCPLPLSRPSTERLIQGGLSARRRWTRSWPSRVRFASFHARQLSLTHNVSAEACSRQTRRGARRHSSTGATSSRAPGFV